MFWDGSRWTTQEAASPAPRPARSRTRDWLATAGMALVVVAAAIPFVATSATSPGPDLIASWSSSYTTQTLTEASKRIAYKGNWTRGVNAQFMGGKVLNSRGRGASASLRFTGTGITWISAVGPNHGSARVYINGVLIKTVSTQSAIFAGARAVFTKTFAVAKPRTISIVVNATKGHPVVSIDSLVIRGAPIAVADLSKKPPSPTPSQPNAPVGTPKMVMSSDIGQTSSSTTLSLSGFGGGAAGQITFDGGDSGMPAYTTSATGVASVTVTIPADASVADHQIGARNSNGKMLIERTFTVSGTGTVPAPAVTPAPTPAPAVTPAPIATPAPTGAPTPTPVPTAAPTAPPVTTGSFEGFGSITNGGAGMPVVHVTTLSDSGTGSLRSAVSGSNRRIVFDVGGTINLGSQLYITGSNLTIDGGTAPAPGITLAGHTLYMQSAVHDIVISQIRHRGGWAGGQDADGITMARGVHAVVIDHVSISGYYDEAIDNWDGVYDVTISNSLIGAGGATDHNYGILIGKGSQRISVHHNLIDGVSYRQPAVGWDDASGTVAPGIVGDIVNNVIWDYSLYGTTVYWGGKGNVVGNYYFSSSYPGSNRAIVAELKGQAYVSGNFSKDGSSITGGNAGSAFAVDSYARVAASSVLTNAANVKAGAGCRVGGLDSVDRSILAGVSL